jgi:FkbM family methyltransferase
MGMFFTLATRVARSPLDPPLRWLASRLQRYADIADNLNNCDFASNGERMLIERGAPHWRVALDVGANLGDWAREVTAVNPACAVHCFEASPSTFESLRARLGGVANVTLHAAGAGEVDGTLAFHDHGTGSTLSSFVTRDEVRARYGERIVEVPVRRLDSVLAELGASRVDFIKVDTEGYELPVLAGLSASLAARAVDCVQFEYGGTWLDARRRLQDACKLFDAHGYAVHRLLPDRVARFTYDTTRDEHYKYANFVATHDPGLLHRWGVPAA